MDYESSEHSAIEIGEIKSEDMWTGLEEPWPCIDLWCGETTCISSDDTMMGVVAENSVGKEDEVCCGQALEMTPPSAIDEEILMHGLRIMQTAECRDSTSERMPNEAILPHSALPDPIFGTSTSAPNDHNMEVDNDSTIQRPEMDSEISPPRPAQDDADEYGIDHGDGVDGLYEGLASKYDLRPQARIQPLFSTWMDQDDSGCYDPSEARRRPPVRRGKPKPGLSEQSSFTGHASKESRDRHVRERPKLVVHMEIKNEEKRSTLKAALERPPVRSGNFHLGEIHDDFADGYRLRNSTFRLARGVHPLELNAQTSNLPADLTGHPIARGCWECLGLGPETRCSLLDDELAWPCATCLRKGQECTLVMPPKVKQACEKCKSRKLACSFTAGSDHSGDCQQCVAAGHRCVAGPAKDGTIPRIRYAKKDDGEWVPRRSQPISIEKPFKPLLSGKLKRCIQCKEAGWDCSLSTLPAEDCTSCKKHDRICIQQDVPDLQPKSGSVTLKRKAPETTSCKHRDTPSKRVDLKPAAAKDTAMKDNAPLSWNGGKQKTITTKFCHPIAFNYEDATGTNPCHFCTGSSYPILGLGAKQVEVIEWADGRGLTEIGNGHQAAGMESTRMCTVCLMQRCGIIMCPTHNLRPIPGVSAESLDFDAALMALFSGTPRAQDRFCALCLNLASHECTTLQEQDSDEAAGPTRGCGLLLCVQCASAVADIHSEGFQGMVATMHDGDREERPLGLRADWDLLQQSGLLMKYIVWSSRQ